jgi:AcrR family transcriptional regulator
MTTGAVSPRRADTRRNHERILAAAAESLARSGEVSFNAVAKRAEVGVGTVYRHFPTPEALILAVYQREVRHLVDVVPSLLEAHPPDRAFRIWTTTWRAT